MRIFAIHTFMKKAFNLKSAFSILSILAPLSSWAIVGGQIVEKNSYFAKRSVAVRAGNKLCSGTVISNDQILTAAHCATQELNQMSVWATENIWNEKDRLVVEVIKTDLARNFSSALEHSDLAVLFLKNSLPENKFEAARILPNQIKLSNVNQVLIAGHGRINPTTWEGAGILRVANGIPVIKQGELEFTLDQSAGKGACISDSGAGVYFNEENNYYLVGAVKGGDLLSGIMGSEQECSYHSIFSLVSTDTVLDWLYSIINQ